MSRHRKDAICLSRVTIITAQTGRKCHFEWNAYTCGVHMSSLWISQSSGGAQSFRRKQITREEDKLSSSPVTCLYKKWTNVQFIVIFSKTIWNRLRNQLASKIGEGWNQLYPIHFVMYRTLNVNNYIICISCHLFEKIFLFCMMLFSLNQSLLQVFNFSLERLVLLFLLNA